jgi:hypothetical protein
MKRMVRTCVSDALVLALAAVTMGMAMPPMYQDMLGIVQGSEKSAGKIARLRTFLGRAPESTVLNYMHMVDEAAAREVALERFRRGGATRSERLEIGHLLMSAPWQPEAFADEYARFLLDAVLHGGREEFLASRSRAPTAVGEYAYIAADFEGMSSSYFPKIADPRVIPALIAGLDAPDHVWPKDQGDVSQGKPGDPTGRNVPRQLLPLALAKLHAQEAIPSLQRVVRSHPDVYLRVNAAEALGILLDKPGRQRLKEELIAQQEHDPGALLFALGRGMVAAGDEAGYPLISIRYEQHDGHDEVLYSLEERLKLVREKQTPALAAFYRDALTYGRLMPYWNLDAGAVQVPRWARQASRPNVPDAAAEYLAACRGRVIKAYAEVLHGVAVYGCRDLVGEVAAIGKKSGNEEIWRLSEETVKRLNALPQPNP